MLPRCYVYELSPNRCSSPMFNRLLLFFCCLLSALAAAIAAAPATKKTVETTTTVAKQTVPKAAEKTATTVTKQTTEKAQKTVAESSTAAIKDSATQADKTAKTDLPTTDSANKTKESSDKPPAPTGPKLTVNIKGIKDEKLLNNAKAFLDIYQGNGEAVNNTSYVQFLADAGVEQIKQSLHPFGYYLAKVDMKRDESSSAWTVIYDVTLGKPVTVKKIDVNIEGEGKQQRDFNTLVADYPLKAGDVLLQQKYTAFKDDIMALATTDGYFDGKFTQKQIVLSDDLEKADILVAYNTGKRYVFGKTTFKQDFLDDDVFQRFVTYKEGDKYSSKSIADVQRDLYNSNYVKMIDVTAKHDTKAKNVPVEFGITPKKNKKHTFSFGYGTNTGIRAKYDFDWRWVNRRGHQFKANAYAAQKMQSLGAEYRIPAARPATDYYKFFANAERKKYNNKDSVLWNLGGAYHDQKGNWEREIGIKWQREDFTLGNDRGNVGLLTPYASLTYRKVDNPLNISRGLRVSGTVTGGHTSALSGVSFLQAVANAKAIRRFGEVNKVTLSGGIGRTWVNDFHQLPAAYRFFTGGDKTIRGYRFEHIGERDSSNTNIGGNKMYYISAEYEYFFHDNMAAAVFIDAGDAYSSNSARLKVGAGVGFHYYSPIGPIKVDVAHGFHEPGDTIRLHLNIGPSM